MATRLAPRDFAPLFVAIWLLGVAVGVVIGARCL